MPFSNLIGNELAKSALVRLVEKKSVPHALLFTGAAGIGKALFAKAFTSLLMGKEHAIKIEKGIHPDVHDYYPEGKSAIHPVENIRTLIAEAGLPPFEAPLKVFIVHDAHQMQPASSNALLKTLEEPYENTYFILLTHSEESLLPTIASRCRTIPFFPLLQREIEAFVQEKWGKTAEEARRIAFLSHGSLGKAQEINSSSNEEVRSLIKAMLTLTLPYHYSPLLNHCIALEEALSSDDEEGKITLFHTADMLFEELIAWYRDLHLLSCKGAPELLYHLDAIEELNAALKHPFPPLEQVLHAVDTARLALHRHFKVRTVFSDLLMKLLIQT